MRAFVIGTSNSILKGGWYDGFQSTFAGESPRYVLGGAPFSQLTPYAAAVAEEKPDFVILDCTPNDQIYHGLVGSIGFFLDLYTKFISSLAHHSNLIVLQLPARDKFEDREGLRYQQAAIVRRTGGLAVDVASIITKTLQHQDHRDLYDDQYHLKLPHAFSIGEGLGSFLSAGPNLDRSRMDYSRCFQLEAGRSVSDARIRVKNSLVDVTFTRLSAGQELLFGGDKLCLGFFFHSGECTGLIKLHAADRETLIYMRHDSDKGRGFVRFQPIPNGIMLSKVSLPLVEFGFQCDAQFLAEHEAQIGMGVMFDPSRQGPGSGRNHPNPIGMKKLESGLAQMLGQSLAKPA